MTRRREGQSGVALVLALATFAITITACVAVARVAATEKLRRLMSRCESLAVDLGRHAEQPILHWLEHESAQVVLAPEAATPEVLLVHDLFGTEGSPSSELTITAWDECGLIPIARLRGGSALRLSVPVDVAETIDRVPLGKDLLPIGLDLWEGQGSSPFPQGRERDPLVFGTTEMVAMTSRGDGESVLALGACVATHNERFLVNVNTAPVPLVDAALRLLGRGGLEQILDARAHGKPATVSGETARPTLDGNLPHLVVSSNAWAFRIDVRVGGVRRSWWSVSQRDDSRWRCVQRLAITS